MLELLDEYDLSYTYHTYHEYPFECNVMGLSRVRILEAIE